MSTLQCNDLYIFYLSVLLLMKYLLLFLIFFSVFSITHNLNPLCSACHYIVKTIQHSVPLAPSKAFIDQIGTIYCTKKHLQNQNVCKGAVQEMSGIILNSVWKHYTDPHKICHQIQMCPKQYIYRNVTAEINEIIKDKPSKQWQEPKKTKILKVMHISDLHLDLYYAAGAQAKCSEPVCCRDNVTKSVDILNKFSEIEKGQVLQSKKKDSKVAAGYWGSLASCDLPIQTYQLFLQELSKLKLDLVIWTGDNTPHDIWQQTQDYNLNFTMILAQKLKKYTNSTVISAMGNHESAPVNVYDFQGSREDTLKAGLANAWREWLDPTAYQMLRTKGYYSITLPNFNNIKIISFNCQVGNDQNWFLLRDPTDPGQILSWIQKELKQSQQKKQFVYIVSHIPIGDMMNDWSLRFNALIDRYSYTVRGQFYGHSHEDQLQFFHSFTKKDQITGYSLIAPSLTTYSNKNPQYRLLDVDFDTLQVVDYHQYELHLERNPTKDSKPKFQLLYSFLQTYKLKDMTLKGGITEIANKLKDDPQTQIKYTSLKRGSCQKGHAGKDVYCGTLTYEQIQTQCNGGVYKPSPFQKIAGRWKTLKHKQNEQQSEK